MNATIYWTGQRIQRAVHEAPFSAKLWWLNQQVGFLEWRCAWMHSSQRNPLQLPFDGGTLHALSNLRRHYAQPQ
jgi:hypothetical protein